MSNDGETVRFAKYYGGKGDDRGYSVQETSDQGFIITGYSTSTDINNVKDGGTLPSHGGRDVYLIKTDSEGNEEWAKLIGGAGYDEGHSVHQTFDGGYIITGFTDSYGKGENDVYLIKTDDLGNTLPIR